MSSLLALDEVDRAIGDFFVGLPVHRHPDRKPARCVISNNLNAANGLAPRPLSNGLQALFSESPVAHSDCFPFRHAANILGRVGKGHRSASRSSRTVEVAASASCHLECFECVSLLEVDWVHSRRLHDGRHEPKAVEWFKRVLVRLAFQGL
jgi:hypothetical protein